MAKKPEKLTTICSKNFCNARIHKDAMIHVMSALVKRIGHLIYKNCRCSSWFNE